MISSGMRVEWSQSESCGCYCSAVRPSLVNTVLRDSSGQRFCLAPGWTLLSPQPWAIEFILEWEFASGFID